ncbi:MAG: TRAP transporter substrate-binding protein DctP [Deltaproteobacteria bacterium]|nr:TRAP transporter substrate-binding protein DctP [Deltaproteobacteria bacterium]
MIRISIMVMFITLLTGQAGALTLKVATVFPDGSVWMKKMREGVKEVAQKTSNRVLIKYYPGSVMGDDETVLRKIRIGQLHGAIVVAGSLSKFYPDNQIYSLPLKFKSIEEVDYVRERVDQLIIDGMEKVGFTTLGLAGGGFAYILSKKPLHTIGDLRKSKVWVPSNDETSLEAVKYFDLSPIPLSIVDVRTGLQTGLIDTVATSPIGAIALQWHTQVNYLMDLPLFCICGIFAVDQKVFSKLSAGDQSLVRDIMGRMFREVDRQIHKDNVQALEALRNQGIKFISPSAEALDEWYAATSDVPNRLIEAGKLSQGMLNTLEGHLKDFRLRQSKVNE